MSLAFKHGKFGEREHKGRRCSTVNDWRAIVMAMVLLGLTAAPIWADGNSGAPQASPATVASAQDFEAGPFWLDGAAAKNAADRANAWNQLSSCEQRAILLADAARPSPETMDTRRAGASRGRPEVPTLLQSLKEYFLGKPAYADCGTQGNLHCIGPNQAQDEPRRDRYCCTPDQGLPCNGGYTVHHWGVWCVGQDVTCDTCNGQGTCQTIQGLCSVCTYTYYDCDACCLDCLSNITLPCGSCNCPAESCDCSTSSACSPNPPQCTTWEMCPVAPYPQWLQRCPP